MNIKWITRIKKRKKGQITHKQITSLIRRISIFPAKTVEDKKQVEIPAFFPLAGVETERSSYLNKCVTHFYLIIQHERRWRRTFNSGNNSAG